MLTRINADLGGDQIVHEILSLQARLYRAAVRRSGLSSSVQLRRHLANISILT